MNENPQNIDKLQRLLKFKRHEVPPPGYFDHFSGQVIARIRAGEGKKSKGQLAWLSNFFTLFEAHPGMAGGAAVSLCALLLMGVFVGEFSEPATQGEEVASVVLPGDPALANNLASQALAMVDSGGISINTNTITSLQPMTMMFGQPSRNPFQSASFLPAH